MVIAKLKNWIKKNKNDLIICGFVVALGMLIADPVAYAVTPWYNLTNLSTSDDLVGIMRWANEATSNWYGILILIGMFFVFLIAFVSNGKDPKEAVTASAFIFTIVAILFRALTLVNEKVILAGIIVTAAGYVWMIGWGESP